MVHWKEYFVIFMRLNRIALAVCLSTLSGTLLSGCNVFGPFDNPTSETQLLSAARACFDQGDLPCAREYYNRISGTDADIAVSEGIFASLAEQGATMTGVIEFVGNGANGHALTKFAERLSSGAGETRRLAIHSAFKRHTEITDSSLKAFAKFVSALSLTAEILGEAAGPDGTLSKTDLALSEICSMSELTGNPGSHACDFPATGNLDSSGTTADILTNTPTGSKPNFDQVYWAIKYTYNALQELQAGGDFGKASTGLQDILNQTGGNTPSGAGATAQNSFRAQLVGTGGFNIGN
jgi:hypothetical protein